MHAKFVTSISLATVSLGAAWVDWVGQHITVATLVAVGAGLGSIWASIETIRLRRAERRRVEREDRYQ